MSNRTKRKVERKALVLMILFVLGAVGAFLYYDWQVANRDRIFVQFKRGDGTVSSEFRLDQALTPAARQRGLMYKKADDMGAHEGMFFGFPDDSDHMFWMRNTYLALDIIFLSAEMKVVGVLEDMTPLGERGRSLGKSNRFAVELHAGTAKRERIEAGATMELTSGAIPFQEVR